MDFTLKFIKTTFQGLAKSILLVQSYFSTSPFPPFVTSCLFAPAATIILAALHLRVSPPQSLQIW